MRENITFFRKHRFLQRMPYVILLMAIGAIITNKESVLIIGMLNLALLMAIAARYIDKS